MENFKKEIKKLAEEQKSLKNQRKSVYFNGIRTHEPWEATYRHYVNRNKLRIMYAAYGVLHGKTYSQIENHYPEDNHPLKQFENDINLIIEKYAKEIVCSDKQ